MGGAGGGCFVPSTSRASKRGPTSIWPTPVYSSGSCYSSVFVWISTQFTSSISQGRTVPCSLGTVLLGLTWASGMMRVRPWDSGPLQVLLGATGVCPFVPGLTLTAALFTVNPDSLSCELTSSKTLHLLKGNEALHQRTKVLHLGPLAEGQRFWDKREQVFPAARKLSLGGIHLPQRVVESLSSRLQAADCGKNASA